MAAEKITISFLILVCLSLVQNITLGASPEGSEMERQAYKHAINQIKFRYKAREKVALKYCEECGHQVSDQAAACPNCGKPSVKAQVSEMSQEMFTCGCVCVCVGSLLFVLFLILEMYAKFG